MGRFHFLSIGGVKRKRPFLLLQVHLTHAGFTDLRAGPCVIGQNLANNLALTSFISALIL